MHATTTQFGIDFVRDLIPWMLLTFDDATRQAYRMIWSAFISFTVEHWIAISIVLVVIFLIALAQALAGYWGMLGSVLYNYLYFGILFMVGLVKGPEVFVSEYFEIVCLFLLYPVCYFIVGRILDAFGLRRRF